MFPFLVYKFVGVRVSPVYKLSGLKIRVVKRGGGGVCV